MVPSSSIFLHSATLTLLLIGQTILGDSPGIPKQRGNLFFHSKLTCVQDPPEETELRFIITTLLKTLETNDFEGYIKLWSQNSPTHARRVERMPKQMASTKFKFGNPVFSHTNITTDKASLRLAVDSETLTLSDVQPLNQRIIYNFTFMKEGGSWKLWNQTDAQRDLAAALTAAKSEKERDALLESEAELVNIYLTQDLTDQGKADFFRNPKEAMLSFQLAYDIAERLHNQKPNDATKQTVATTLHNLANVERALGNYDKVLDYEGRVLSLTMSESSKAEAFVNIGIVHALQNNYDLALRFFENALRSARNIAAESTRSKMLGFIHDSTGNVYTLQGKADEALAEYKNSLNHRTAPLERADTFDNMGIAYELKGEFKAAEEQYQASLKAFEGKYSLGTATVLNNLASITLKSGDPKGSIEYAKRSAQIAAEIEMPELQWRAALIQGKAHRALGEIPAARHSLEQSIQGIENMRKRIGGGLEERQRFLEDKIEPFNAMIDLLMSEGHHDEAFRYMERAKAKVLIDVLSSDIAVIRKVMSSDELLQEQNYLFQLATLDGNIRQAQLNTSIDAAALASLRDQQKTTKNNYDEFISRLYAKYSRLPTSRGKPSVIKLEETGTLLPDEQSVLLEFSVGENRTYLCVISRSGANAPIKLVTHKIEVKKETLKKQVEKFRSEIDNHGPDFREPGANLFRLLLGPAQKQLAGKKTLLIVPDGPLWELPFEALQATNGRFLVETGAIFQAPSLTALREMSITRTKSAGDEPFDFMAFLNPTVSSEVERRVQALQNKELSRLPDARKQMDELRRIYGSPPRNVIYTGNDASEKRFVEEAGRYRTLYLFTHGVLDDRQPMRSFVVLSPTGGATKTDGLVEASELLRMKVRADLIIFSGCETARGGIRAGEGIIGLTWASFVAGSPAVVVSHWRVPIEGTPLLMLEFHRILKNREQRDSSNVTVARALQLASLKVKNTKGYEHPLYWAGFTIVGDGR